jgi:trk system potassium uptake protein TrkH
MRSRRSTNAGISLYSDNLSQFVRDPIVVLVVTLGFIVGGLGFLILFEIWRREQMRRAAENARDVRVKPWSLHLKITLSATFALLLIGPLML